MPFTSLPGAVIYRNPAAMAPKGVPLQPTQVYEAIGLAVLFAVLWAGRARFARPGAGAVAASYLIGVAGVTILAAFLGRQLARQTLEKETARP